MDSREKQRPQWTLYSTPDSRRRAPRHEGVHPGPARVDYERDDGRAGRHAHLLLHHCPRTRIPGAGDAHGIFVPSSCVTATDKCHRTEPVKADDVDLEMAEHYGCTAIPARVRRLGGGEETSSSSKAKEQDRSFRTCAHTPKQAPHKSAPRAESQQTEEPNPNQE